MRVPNRRDRRRGGRLAGQVQSFRSRLAEAEALARSGRFDQALRVLDRLLAEQPSEAAGWHLKGALLLQRAEAGPAAQALERALALAPDDPLVLTNLGAAQHLTGLTAAAEATLKRAMALRPGFAPAHFNLALVLKERLAAGQAIAQLRETVRIDPAHAKAWLELGRLLSDREEWDEALTCLGRAGGSADALEIAGSIEQRRGDFAAALAHYDAALKLKENRASVALARASCLQELGELEAALDAYKVILRQDLKLYATVLKQLTTASKGRLWLNPAKLREVLLEA